MKVLNPESDYKKADIITHSGVFHLDEIIAIRLYEIATGKKDLTVMRLDKVPNDFQGVVIDLNAGEKTNATVFDHHNEKRDKETSEGSSCGIVFEHFKTNLIEKMFGKDVNADLAEKVFKSDILNFIENNDIKGGADYKNVECRNYKGENTGYLFRPITLSSVIRQYNPPYFAKDQTDKYFENAYSVVSDFLNQYAKMYKENIQKGLIRDYYKNPSNFNRRNFSFNKERIEELCNPAKARAYNSSLQAAERGLSVYKTDPTGNDTRMLSVGDVATLGDETLTYKFFDLYKEGLEANQRGFEMSQETLNEQIEKVKSENKTVLVLDDFVPWKSAVTHTNFDVSQRGIDFVIYPSLRPPGSYNVAAVQTTPSSKEYRVAFPEEYIQSDIAELMKKTDGEVTFCNNYLMTVKSLDKAIEIATSLSEQAKILEIPEGTTVIGPGNIFNNRATAEQIIFPKSTEAIAKQAFMHCKHLEEVTVPENVLIHTGAFSDCTSLSSVEIKPGIQQMGYYAFAGCGEIDKVKLPDTIKALSPITFDGTDVKNVEITMTSFKNLPNVYKIASCFPDAEITIDGKTMGYEKFTFKELDEMVGKLISLSPDLLKDPQREEQNYERDETRISTIDELVKDAEVPKFEAADDIFRANHDTPEESL